MTEQAIELDPPQTTAGDMFLSMNGFDEIAVVKAFNADIAELREQPFRFLRALAFVAERRTGAKDADAYKTVMTLTVAQVSDYFLEDEDELDPEDPVTVEGKDDAPSS